MSADFEWTQQEECYSAENSQFLEPGKATTRSKRSITAALRALHLLPQPHAEILSDSAISLETADA